MIEYGVGSTVIDSLFGSTYANSQANLDALAGNILGQGIDNFQKGNYVQAINSFRRSAALSPFSDNAAKAYDYIGKTYLQQEKITDAIKLYKEAIRIYPQRAEFRQTLGDIYLQEEMPEEALKAFEAAVKVNPADEESRYSLGQSYLNAGELAKAHEQFAEVVRLSPVSAAGFYGLGQVARAEGDLDEAISKLNQAIRINRNFEIAYAELGRTYADKDDFRNAEDMLSILDGKNSDKSVELSGYIEQARKPRIIMASGSNGFDTMLGSRTEVSALNSSLEVPGTAKLFSMNFAFSKDMDVGSVVNPVNWNISRAAISGNAGIYNNGLRIPATEAFIMPKPVSVTYDTSTNKATVSFLISQNSKGTATIDPRHIVFKFSGVDAYNKSMDPAADQYSGFSHIV